MSSAGTLAKGQYSLDTLEMARRNQDFVMGFITQRDLNDAEHDEDEDFLSLTPGVQMVASGEGDNLGQQYNTPRDVIVKNGCDIIIVGRGIYGKPDQIAEKAAEYQRAGWNAYLERCAGKPVAA